MLSTTHTSQPILFPADGSNRSAASDRLGKWAQSARAVALEKAQANISPADGQPGAVLASPSKEAPNYYFHWVRDGARTMRAFVHLYATYGKTQRGQIQEELFDMLERYVLFSKLNQVTPTKSHSLGEPKFHVSGEGFFGPWGRPQNDGPAQRALVLTRWAKILLQEGREAYVRGVLYDAALPTYSVIKADLEFVAHHWQQACFDLWEEVDGIHFFTRLQQRVALVEGASLAQALGDTGAAEFYRAQAAAIEEGMEAFWSPSDNYLRASLTPTNPPLGQFKPTDLDAAVVLASAETFSAEAPFYAPDCDRVLATAYALSEHFRALYPINQVAKTPKGEPLLPAIGRYPGDTYNGSGQRDQGNPWFLCTLALAEICYKAASLFKGRESIAINDQNVGMLSLGASLVAPRVVLQAGTALAAGSKEFAAVVSGLIASGDGYLRRVQQHAGADGSLSEQFSRTTGEMLSARDLTWSYVAMVLAANWRAQVV